MFKEPKNERIKKNLLHYQKLLNEISEENQTEKDKLEVPHENSEKYNYKALCRGDNIFEVS